MNMLSDDRFVEKYGVLTKLTGNILQAKVPGCFVGEVCQVIDPLGSHTVQAEVIGFEGEYALLTLLGRADGIRSNSIVKRLRQRAKVPVGPDVLGRVLGPTGHPIDGGMPLADAEHREILAQPPSPMSRTRISEILEIGIPVIDGLLTCAVGQRIGIFGSAGTGKSTLLSQIMERADVDVVVLGLIGERGREVREFVEKISEHKTFERTCVIVSTSDSPPLERVRAADAATTVSECFRDQGKRVLLIIDSVTRVARAFREVGLAAGEPPTRRGFPPSVFSHLPILVERSGTSSTGSITAFYTILVEGGDDDQDPVADELRGLLDAHVILSRDIAARGQYPAIDVPASVSRLMNDIVSDDHRAMAQKFRGMQKSLDDVEFLLKVGEYQSGSDANADFAIQKRQMMHDFLYGQNVGRTSFDDTLAQLKACVS